MVVVNYGETIDETRSLLLNDISKINYMGKYFRKDIGKDLI